MAVFNRLIKETVFRCNIFGVTCASCSLVSKRKLSYLSLNTNLSKPHFYLPCIVGNRFSHTFLSRLTAEQLWRGSTTVSNAGRKRGRGKQIRKKAQQDLNRGQIIGCGKKAMLWPGLNAPVIRGKEIISQQELPSDDLREKRIMDMRNNFNSTKRKKLPVLERGWTGDRLPGRSIGPPDPIGDDAFEGFDSRVLMFKSISKMTSKRGRVRKMQALVVSGNKNGIFGYGIASSPNGNTAANHAKNKCGQVLRFIRRSNNHTILHDFHSTYGAITVFAAKKPEGYGIVSHRAIKAICEMAGIKDLYVKVVKGNTKHIIAVTRAFIIGLMKQRSHQELADSMGMHLIELRKERDDFPEVVASPKECRTKEDIGLHEVTNFDEIIHNGKVMKPKKEFVPFYINFDSHKRKLMDLEKYKHQREVRIRLLAKYGKLESYLTIREAEKEKQMLIDTVKEGAV